MGCGQSTDGQVWAKPKQKMVPTLPIRVKMESNIDSIIGKIKKDTSEKCQKQKTLQQVDLIVLDTSIRESTFGQLRGHTLGCFLWLLEINFLS